MRAILLFGQVPFDKFVQQHLLRRRDSSSD